MSSQTVVSKDQAEAAGFSAAVDLDEVALGSSFRATWTFKNTGQSTWNGRYRLTYTLAPHSETSGFQCSPLGSPTTLEFSAIGGANDVAPGGTVSLTVTFKAPTQTGTFATNWQLQTPDGQRFGPVRWLRAVVTSTASVIEMPAGGTDTQLAYESVSFSNSVPNFNNMPPGRQFSGTWNLRNTGAPLSGKFKVVYQDKATTGTENMVRSQMGAPASVTLKELTGRDAVKNGESVDISIDLVAPTSPGSYAYQWQLQDENGRSFGGTRWLQINVNGATSGPTAPSRTPSSGETEFGMNVNINNGHGLDVDRLAGLGWVRFVFWASREKNSPEEAYQKRYRNIIQSYADKGIRSLIILHQDTYWGNGPWDNGGWDTYAENFGKECARVAKACSEFGDMVAYQIYNEQDSGFGNDAPYHNPSAITIAPENYALVLAKAAPAIREAHPGAKIIYGGLKTGPGNAIDYTRIVEKKLGGKLPVDAIAYHPYGRYVKHKIFNFGSIGTLGDGLNMFKKAFPDMPLWITEVGAASDSPIGSEHYEDISIYMQEAINEVADNYSDLVPVLIWFGWTDMMRNSGINTADDKPKPFIYDAFTTMKNRDKGAAKSVDLFEETNEATFISYATTLSNLKAVPAESEFESSWVFTNSGTTTWDADYIMKYVPVGENPDPLAAKTSYKFSEVADKMPVEPGKTAKFTLPMTAPSISGRTYYSRWQLCDPQGTPFFYFYEEITVSPKTTVGTSTRSSGMTFIDDQTVPDNSPYVAGTDFDKQWLVKNSGARHWSEGFRLVYIEGDLQMAHGATTHLVPSAKTGETVTLSIPMTAPPASNGVPTTYKTMWRMQDDHGNVFGDPLWVVIVSTTAVSPITGGNTALARLLNDQTLWYSQVDTSWARDQLGTGQATIGSWGCLMTCMAMALSAYGTRFNPKELNQWLIKKGAEVMVGSTVQFVAPWYAGGLRYRKNVKSWPNSDVPVAIWTGEDPIQRIDNALAAGEIVVAQVDTKPNNGFYNSNNEQHWVVIVKRTSDGSDYLMIDPLTSPQQVMTQPRSLMAKYGNPIPSRSNEENLRNAIKSTLVYYKSGGSGS